MIANQNLSPIARLLTMKDALDEARAALDPNRKQKVQALRATLAKDYKVSEADVELIATICYDTEFAPRSTMRDMMTMAALWPMPTVLDTIGQCQWIVDCLAANGTCVKAESTLGMNATRLREKLEEVITESIGVFDPTAAIEVIEFNRCDDGFDRLPVTFWMARPQDGVLQFTIQGGSDAH
jgi:hypothetical protein